MKISRLILAALLASPISAFADDTFPAVPAETLPVACNNVDWQDDGMVIMEDGKGFVALHYNQEGIQFQVLIKDRKLQQQFLHRGMVTYIDLNGKKKQKYAVKFPTLAPPEGMDPRKMGAGRRDTAGVFGDIGPGNPREGRKQPSKEERERMLKFLVSQTAGKPASFMVGEEESMLPAENATITTSGNNVIFSAFVPYNMLEGKVGKKGEIAIGVTLKEIEFPAGGFPGGGMFGPPPGMIPGGMPPPLGMGAPGMGNPLKDVKTFSEWIVFTIKNTNFTSVKD